MTSVTNVKSVKVTFSPNVEIYTVKNRFEYSLKEWRNTWYKYYELLQIRQEAFAIALQIETLQLEEENEGENSTNCKPTTRKSWMSNKQRLLLRRRDVIAPSPGVPVAGATAESAAINNEDILLSNNLRGLEVYTVLGKARACNLRRQAYDAVLREQILQLYEPKSKSQDMIALVYRKYTARCVEEARQVGIMDAKWVTSNNIDNMEKNGSYLYRRRRRQQQQEQQQQRMRYSYPTTIPVMSSSPYRDGKEYEFKGTSTTSSRISKLVKKFILRRSSSRGEATCTTTFEK